MDLTSYNASKKFNFIEFLNRSKSTCGSKSDFTERIQGEIEAISEIKDKRTSMDRLNYKHQLELTKLAVQCGSLMNKGRYHNEIADLLDRLKD